MRLLAAKTPIRPTRILDVFGIILTIALSALGRGRMEMPLTASSLWGRLTQPQ